MIMNRAILFLVASCCAMALFPTPAAAVCTCATITADQLSIDGGGGFLTIEVTDPVAPLHDCNGNGIADDPADCGGVIDPLLGAVFVRVFSPDEPDGEPLLLEQTGALTGIYRGTIGVSTKLNVPGVVFVNSHGTRAAVVRAAYFDNDCQVGAAVGPCLNSCTVTNDYNGQLEVSVPVTVSEGVVVVRGTRLDDSIYGDGDHIPDDNETIEMHVTLINKSGVALTGVRARLQVDSSELNGVFTPGGPEVDGILVNEIDVPDMMPGAEITPGLPFVFHVGPLADRVPRGIVTEDLFNVRFRLLVSANEFDVIRVPQEIVYELDLEFAGGSFPSQFLETFEAAVGFGHFGAMHLDDGLASLAGSDGYRCQYRDPDECITSNFLDATCFLGVDPIQNAAFHWQLSGPPSPDGGRAFAGIRSLHFGVPGTGAPGSETTPTGTLEAARTVDPINLNWDKVCSIARGVSCVIDFDCQPGEGVCVDVASELSFWHQISLADGRVEAMPAGETLDGAVLQAQRADADGNSMGRWETLYPYQNIHDAQRTVSGTRCQFDPVDDGSTEDSFFSSTDVLRKYGPSSTCYDRPVFGYQGDTKTFNPLAIGRATDGPGQVGSSGVGTWVETRYNLERYRGLRIRLRFLVSTANDAASDDWAATGLLPADSPADDGWYIDDVHVTDTLINPTSYTTDIKDNSGLPSVGAICHTVVPSLTATPDMFPVGGGVTELSAEGSVADICVDGTLQYRYGIDADCDNILDELSGDVILQDFLDVSTFTTTVVADMNLGVEVRCSSDPSCNGIETVFVDVAKTPGEATSLLLTPIGTDLKFDYTPACNAFNHTLYYTFNLADVAAGTYPGQVCNIGTTGTITIPTPIPPIVFWVVVGHDGCGKEGSYGASRPEDTSDVTCSRVQDLTDPCP